MGFSYALLCFGLSKHGGWKRLKTSTIFFDYFIQRISFLPVNEAIQEFFFTKRKKIKIYREIFTTSLEKKRKNYFFFNKKKKIRF